MATLPTLETPTYEVVIPSTGKKVKYRPYLVKEEKILMIALETGDVASVFQAVKDIIDACTFGKVDVSKLCTFDMEYIFLKLRTKSTGEVSKIGIKCEKCEKSNAISINLDKIEQPKKDAKLSNKIQLTDKIGVVVRWPSMDALTELASENAKEDLATALKIVARCIESVYDEDKVYPTEEQSFEEVMKFVESLSQAQFKKINDYVNAMPRLKHTCEFVCTHCKAENSITITGLQNFFE